MAVNTERESLTGLTEAEAKEFHGYFVASMIAFTVVAIGAHVLLYVANPWFNW